MDLHRAGVALLGAKGTSPSRLVAHWWIWRGDRRAMKPGIAAASATSSCTDHAESERRQHQPEVRLSCRCCHKQSLQIHVSSVQMQAICAADDPESARGRTPRPLNQGCACRASIRTTQDRRCQQLTVILSVLGPGPSPSFSASTKAAAVLLTSVCMGGKSQGSVADDTLHLITLCVCRTHQRSSGIHSLLC